MIFQHGITRSREDLFGVADSFADSGYVVVAIDLPLHGVTNTSDPLYAAGANPLYTGLGLPASGSIERTFDLDVENNATGQAGADGQIDPSGSHFINLTSVLTSRDNLREGVADLIALTRTLPQLNLGAAGGINPAAHPLPRPFPRRHRRRRLHERDPADRGRHRDARHARRWHRRPAARVPHLRPADQRGPRGPGGVPRHDDLRAVLPRCADRGRLRRSDQLHRLRHRGASDSPAPGRGQRYLASRPGGAERGHAAPHHRLGLSARPRAPPPRSRNSARPPPGHR